MKTLLYILLILTFSSCTITKRVHNPGWHVEWKNRNHLAQKKIESNATIALNENYTILEKNKTDSIINVNFGTIENVETIEKKVLLESKQKKKKESTKYSPIEKVKVLDTIYVYEEDLIQNKSWIPKPIKVEKQKKPGINLLKFIVGLYLSIPTIVISFLIFAIIEFGYGDFIILSSCLISSPFFLLASVILYYFFTFKIKTYSSDKMKKRAKRRSVFLIFLFLEIFFAITCFLILILF